MKHVVMIVAFIAIRNSIWESSIKYVRKIFRKTNISNVSNVSGG